jgi:F5/8 type C domain
MPDYFASGTAATVAANATTVTFGSGQPDMVNMVKEGDGGTLWISGRSAAVRRAINSTTLELVQPWPHGALSAQAWTYVYGVSSYDQDRQMPSFLALMRGGPLTKTGNLVEFNGDPTAQAAARANLGVIDGLPQVISALEVLPTTPAPVNGDRYAVLAGATGQGGKIAERRNGNWFYITGSGENPIWNRATDKLMVSTGSTWQDAVLGNTGPLPFSPPVPFAAGIDAVVGPPATAVTFAGGTYLCTTPHLTTATFLPANWTLLVAPAAAGPASQAPVVPFAAGIVATNVAPRTVVRNGTAVYECITSHTTTSTFVPANWRLLVQDGANGTGTGDVVGPASSVATRLARFSGTTGKLLADGGTDAALVQGVLNGLSTAQGAVMYRDATGWVALAPGTTGQALITGGAGANPSWGTVAGGGGIAADRINNALLHLAQSDAISAPLRLLSAEADSFKTLAGVNTGSSTNYTHSASPGRISPTVTTSTDQTPTMTAPNAPASHVASASSELSASYPAWRAFDKQNSSSLSWYAAALPSVGAPQWLRMDFGVGNAKVIGSYTISPPAATDAPRDWTFRGSNDATTWVTLDARTNETAWVAATFRTFAFSNSTAYRYYEIRCTANNGGGQYYAINEMTMIGVGAVQNMTLISAPETLQASPASARLFFDVTPVDSITLGTDLIAEVSRDGGTTLTTAPLTEVGQIGTRRLLESEDIPFTGAAGTSLTWRLRTLNAKLVHIEGARFTWQ